jgi:hypothetical protein
MDLSVGERAEKAISSTANQTDTATLNLTLADSGPHLLSPSPSAGIAASEEKAAPMASGSSQLLVLASCASTIRHTTSTPPPRLG